LKLEEEKKERLAEEARIKAEKEAAEKKRFREAEAEKRRIKAEKEVYRYVFLPTSPALYC